MISFIIPAHNEEYAIGRTIQSLHAAARGVGSEYEIIVVDDASTDGTGELATSHGATVVPVTCRQIGAARNAGASRARGELFVFVDADTQVTAPVLQTAVGAWLQGAVGGGAQARFDRPVPIYGRTLESLWTWIQRLTGWASGCFLFCSRQAFEAAGGFDPALYIAEDAALSRRLQRLGRFDIIRQPVITSGRTVRLHPAAEAFRIGLGMIRHGRRIFRMRSGPWYAPRREQGASRR